MDTVDICPPAGISPPLLENIFVNMCVPLTVYPPFFALINVEISPLPLPPVDIWLPADICPNIFVDFSSVNVIPPLRKKYILIIILG